MVPHPPLLAPWLSSLPARAHVCAHTLPKVLHPLAGKADAPAVLDVADALQARQVCVIVAPHAHTAIQAACGSHYHYILQHERRGTAHALLQALPAITATDGDVVVLFGDTPLLRNRYRSPRHRRQASPPRHPWVAQL
jgi:bifunctional UDP-N-acetylglucosamine pyrophosphorylase/glucosamine-1-phosphate N-acetyltransferase